jgi:hypothetical protein
MRPTKTLLFAISFFFVTLVHAQGLDDNKGKREVLMMGLYPPDLVMKHQQRLGITDAQRKNISKAVQKFQSDVAQLQWTMQNDQQQLQQLFAGYTIATSEALTQAERVLGLESQFKLAHFKLLIAIKNEMTDEQIDMADNFIKRRVNKKTE